MIIGCSALKRVYRDRIRDTAGGPITFVHLNGSKSLIAQRMKSRAGHFMPPALLDSQFASLEPPQIDESAIAVNIDQLIEELVDEIIDKLGQI